jgi:thiosulfate dehydrogenase
VQRYLWFFFLLAGLAVQANAQKMVGSNRKKNGPVTAKNASLPTKAAAAQASTAPPLPVGDPNPAHFPKGPLGQSIRLGWEIFTATPTYASAYVGNRLNCSDCHLEDGTQPYASPLAGVPGLFPMYNKRAGRVISLADRIQECFIRSENGHPLPYRSPQLVALIAYLQWLSRGQPDGRAVRGRGLVKLPALRGNPARGARIYAQKCVVCHQPNGGGYPMLAPPIWGPHSFSTGAGMSQVAKLAAFIAHNMPKNAPGSLTPQQAFDVAAYVDSQPRPKMNPLYRSY